MARGLLSCSMRAGSSFLTKDQTRAPCIGSTESYPLDTREVPVILLSFDIWPQKKIGRMISSQEVNVKELDRS